MKTLRQTGRFPAQRKIHKIRSIGCSVDGGEGEKISCCRRTFLMASPLSFFLLKSFNYCTSTCTNRKTVYTFRPRISKKTDGRDRGRKLSLSFDRLTFAPSVSFTLSVFLPRVLYPFPSPLALCIGFTRDGEEADHPHPFRMSHSLTSSLSGRADGRQIGRNEENLSGLVTRWLENH